MMEKWNVIKHLNDVPNLIIIIIVMVIWMGFWKWLFLVCRMAPDFGNVMTVAGVLWRKWWEWLVPSHFEGWLMAVMSCVVSAFRQKLIQKSWVPITITFSHWMVSGLVDVVLPLITLDGWLVGRFDRISDSVKYSHSNMCRSNEQPKKDIYQFSLKLI